MDATLGALRREWLTIGAVGVWAVLLVRHLGRTGVLMPVREVVVWSGVGLLSASLKNLRRWARGVLYDWAPLLLIVVTYDAVRAWAYKLGFGVHLAPQLPVDRWLGLGQPVTVRLQDALWQGTSHWWDFAATAVYVSHFFVTIFVAAILWRRDRDAFLRFRARVAVLFAAALATYALYPAAAPWMAAAEGHSRSVYRVVAATLEHPHVTALPATLPSSSLHSGWYNPVAALPSMHAALPALLLLFFWRNGRLVRAALAAYTLCMAFALVYTGEHFLFDVLMGWAYAGAVVTATGWVSRRAAQRVATQPHPTTTVAEPTPDLALQGVLADRDQAAAC